MFPFASNVLFTPAISNLCFVRFLHSDQISDVDRPTTRMWWKHTCTYTLFPATFCRTKSRFGNIIYNPYATESWMTWTMYCIQRIKFAQAQIIDTTNCLWQMTFDWIDLRFADTHSAVRDALFTHLITIKQFFLAYFHKNSWKGMVVVGCVNCIQYLSYTRHTI